METTFNGQLVEIKVFNVIPPHGNRSPIAETIHALISDITIQENNIITVVYH